MEFLASLEKPVYNIKAYERLGSKNHRYFVNWRNIMSKKYCYLFTEGNANMRELLGGENVVLK